MADIYQRSGTDNLSLHELALYHLITDYRIDNGLAPVMLSKALTTTAARHVIDTRENIFTQGDIPPNENLHSWSDAPYRIDPATGRPLDPSVMWEAPLRLGTGYRDSGYEISAAGLADIGAALDGWQGSPRHNEVILNLGQWQTLDFNAMGVGVDTRPTNDLYAGRVYHVWFAEDPDPTGIPRIVGSNGGDRIRGTAFGDDVVALGGADVIAGLGGGDVLWGGAGDDQIEGGNGHDRIYGGRGDNYLRGDAGSDRLVGDDGDDILSAGTGADVLYSGRGLDRMAGGPDADTFVFRTRPEAGIGATRDVIADFETGLDRIDLRVIDADLTRAGNQALDFVGAARFTGTAGEINLRKGVLSADVNGDAVVDFQIDISAASALAPSDLIL